LIPCPWGHYNEEVNFVVHYFLPIFKYLFFAGLLGAIPVIVVTAIKTAQSIAERDAPGTASSGS